MLKLCKTLQLQLISERERIGETITQYVNAMNYISTFAMEHKIWNKANIQQQIYQDIRDKFGIKSQMTINVIRSVTAYYNGKCKHNRKRVDKKGTPFPVEFKSKSMRLNYPRDYGFQDGDMLSLNSLYGRLHVKYTCGDYQREFLDSKEWKIKSAVITLRKDGILFFNVAIERDMEETTFLKKDGVVGTDLGMNFVAVTTDTSGKTDFFGGGKVKYKRWLREKQRQDAQSKGTRSAKRFLRRMRRRETRFVTDQNHCIAKTIVQNALTAFASPMIAMEDLKGIRQQRYIGKIQKTRLNKWAFYQLQQFIEYKALERGIPIIYIDPHYTSQCCPKCGHTEKKNRDRKLHQFRCKKCGYRSNDDRSASINIRDRAVVLRYIRSTRGIRQLPLCSV